MDLIGGISAATEGLKLVNELRKIDKEVDKADLKLRLIELADKLMDAKQALQEAQEREFSLKRRIVELEERNDLKDRLKDFDGLLYEVDEGGREVGEPYCNHCFVKETKLYRLVGKSWDGGTRYDCTNCTFMHLPNSRRRR